MLSLGLLMFVYMHTTATLRPSVVVWQWSRRTGLSWLSDVLNPLELPVATVFVYSCPCSIGYPFHAILCICKLPHEPLNCSIKSPLTTSCSAGGCSKLSWTSWVEFDPVIIVRPTWSEDPSLPQSGCMLAMLPWGCLQLLCFVTVATKLITGQCGTALHCIGCKWSVMRKLCPPW